jgi:hypothetical protein
VSKVPTAATLASYLTSGQRSTIHNLGSEYGMLGCSEPYAVRLSKDANRRPALVEISKAEDGTKLFRLNVLGLMVQSCLTEQDS